MSAASGLARDGSSTMEKRTPALWRFSSETSRQASFGFLARLERALHLGRAFHELVEVHRAELAANHPEIAAVVMVVSLLFSRLNLDLRSLAT